MTSSASCRLHDVACHQVGEQVGVDAPGEVVTRGDRAEGARVVVEAGGVVDARGLRRADGGSASCPRSLSWNHQGGPRRTRGVVAGERRQLARVGRFVEREQQEAEARVVAVRVEQRLQVARVLGLRAGCRRLCRGRTARTRWRCGCGASPGWSCITSPSSTHMRAISMSMWPERARRPGVASPASARSKTARRLRGVDSSRGVRLDAAWSVAVAPIDLKNARRVLERAR